ncbi:hypothetical protein Q5692_05230, partial [Microcoleus sp. C2C3]
VKNRQDACSTIKLSFVERAPEPVPKQLIENSATSQFNLTSCTIVKNRQDACSTIKLSFVERAPEPVPKQLIENSATSQLTQISVGTRQ